MSEGSGSLPVELVGIILDISSSMDSTSYSGKSKFDDAVEILNDLLNRLRNSSLANSYYFTVVGFSAAAPAAILPPFDQTTSGYMHVPEADIDQFKNAIYNTFGGSGAIRSRYGRSGRTDYTTGLRVAIDITKKFQEDLKFDADKIYSTRIMLTDGCHNTNPRSEVYNLARELSSLSSSDSHVTIGSVLVGESGNMCSNEICAMCSDIDSELERKLSKTLTGMGLPSDYGRNPSCKNKLSFIFNTRDKQTLEGVRKILRLVSTTRE